MLKLFKKIHTVPPHHLIGFLFSVLSLFIFDFFFISLCSSFIVSESWLKLSHFSLNFPGLADLALYNRTDQSVSKPKAHQCKERLVLDILLLFWVQRTWFLKVSHVFVSLTLMMCCIVKCYSIRMCILECLTYFQHVYSGKMSVRALSNTLAFVCFNVL